MPLSSRDDWQTASKTESEKPNSGSDEAIAPPNPFMSSDVC
jgi:hypothetical protein